MKNYNTKFTAQLISVFIIFLFFNSCEKDKDENTDSSNNGTNPTWTCGDPIVDTRDGKNYNTAQIGNHCWMAENLNYETGNSWCYEDDPSNCNIYGRLYDWYTLMNGEASSNSVPSGVKGICPDGWHVPGDDEWKILEGTTDTKYPVGDTVWDGIETRGYDAGKRLKSTSGWSGNDISTDAFGFSALPGGVRYPYGGFLNIYSSGYFWTSTGISGDYAWLHYLSWGTDGAGRYTNNKGIGYSLRCVKD